VLFRSDKEINSDYLLPVMRYVQIANKLSLSEEIMIDNNDMYMFAARKTYKRQ
jgi:hypothetical protein